MIQLNIQEPYKTLIISGKKTVEGRLNKGKFADLKIWDILELDDTWEKLEVVNLTPYPNFKAMLENEGLKHTLPRVTSIEEGIAIYHQFYTPAQEAEFWVLAIEVKKKAK